MYNPNSLEEERLSWRSVVYYNIVRPVRRIFEVVDAYADFDEDDSSAADSSLGTSDSIAHGSLSGLPVEQPMSCNAEKQMAALRLRLSPLLATEPSLAERLSGGAPNTAASKGNLFVRTGWQLLGKTKRDQNGFMERRGSLDSLPRRSHDSASTGTVDRDKLIEEVANILNACEDDVKELWEHPTVKRLRDKRRLRLEESAEL